MIETTDFVDGSLINFGSSARVNTRSSFRFNCRWVRASSKFIYRFATISETNKILASSLKVIPFLVAVNMKRYIENSYITFPGIIC